ncbi:MAG: sensor histidine kinase, partial [Pseudomonadota bacterium]
APVVLFAAMVAVILVDNRRVDALRENSHLAQVLASAVDAEMQSEIDALTLLASSPSLRRGDLAAFHARAAEVIAVHSNWATIGVMAPDGSRMLVSSTGPASGPTPPPLDVDSIRLAALEKRPVLGAMVERGFRVAQPLILLRVPVLRDDKVTAVLSASVRTTAVAAIIDRQTMAADCRVAVFDRHGRRVAGDAIEPLPDDGGGGAVDTSAITGWKVVVGSSAAQQAEMIRTAGTVLVGGLLAVLASVAGTLGVTRAFRDHIVAFEQAGKRNLETALDEARRAQAAAASADAAKSRFLAAASHDLRQPFQAMQLYTQVLDALVIEPPRARQALDGLRNAIDAGDELLRSLLDVSSIEAGTVKPHIASFPVVEVIDEVTTEYETVAAERGLTFHVCRSPATVETDRVLLKRIVRNLIHNAFRYTEEGGVLVGCRRRGDRLLIQVWDTGPGIPPDQLEMIFEDFYQLDNPARDRSKGLGLGLSVVRRMARLLCHELTVESRVGKGSVFTIAVPVAPEITPPAG